MCVAKNKTTRVVFGLSSPDEAQSFLGMEEAYAGRERLAMTLNSPLDTAKLDEMLLARSGIVAEASIGESKQDHSGSSVDQAVISESQEVSSELVELWRQVDCELALIDRQKFNSMGFGRTDWDSSKDRAVFDAKEQGIQAMADRLFATLGGRIVHQRFVSEADVSARVQASDAPVH